MIRSAIRSFYEHPARTFRFALVTAVALTALLTFAQRSVAIVIEPQCTLTLTPDTATLNVGEAHTVTATLELPEPPEVPAAVQSTSSTGCYVYEGFEGAPSEVTFTIVSGPNTGATKTVALDENGKATFGWVSALAGTDVIEASVEIPNPYILYALEDQFDPFTTLTASVTATWVAPAPPVVAQVTPRATISGQRGCVSKRLSLSASVTDGTVASSTLYIDGRAVQTRSGSASFSINVKRYKAGRHLIRVVTTLADGTQLVNEGQFRRCQTRTAARRAAPQFAG